MKYSIIIVATLLLNSSALAKEKPDSEFMEILFLELHASIEETASHTVNNLKSPSVTYPPGATLTENEMKAIRNLALSEDAKSGLRKLLLDACSHPSYRFFTLLDGVSDPEQKNVKEWYGATIGKKVPNNDLMLHDKFYESYWSYKKQ